ncbi:hypothetical protein C8Q76DRAFT_717522 [Earliella scabrosa]|nr:hypothetical protein C8Q76DRAFT_717522 [Earliella scabrosa]
MAANTLADCHILAVSRLKYLLHPLKALLTVIATNSPPPPTHCPPLHALFFGPDFLSEAFEVESKPLRLSVTQFVTMCQDPTSQLADASIRRIQYRKAKHTGSGPLHEFLIVTVGWDAGGRPEVGRLVMDRNAAVNPLAANTSPAASTVISHLARDGIILCITEDDITNTIGNARDSQKLLDYTPPSRTPLPITRLAAAASVYDVNDNPLYHPLPANCYWFAALVCLMAADVLPSSSGKHGRFHGIPEASLADVTKLVQEKRPNFQQSLQNINTIRTSLSPAIRQEACEKAMAVKLEKMGPATAQFYAATMERGRVEGRAEACAEAAIARELAEANAKIARLEARAKRYGDTTLFHIYIPSPLGSR